MCATHMPNQFLCVHWSRWENSKQCIWSRLKKVYPTTSEMLSPASSRQLRNLPPPPRQDKCVSVPREGGATARESYLLSQSQ